MVLIRRFLPSMPVMCAFEAAARHESFTAAAAELSLTQSAVSRQIRALEGLLGFDLFIRERQTVRLTAAGARYAAEISAALHHIADATLDLRANPTGGTLNLAVLPAFGARWLAPRLPGFRAEQPDITLNLTSRLGPFAFEQESFDAAIHFGSATWPGAVLDRLMGESLLPLCSPELAARFGFSAPQDLLAAPLLHLTSRPDAWERWFEARGVAHAPLCGMLLDQQGILGRLAKAGMGVALLPRFLFEEEIARGELFAPWPDGAPGAGAYYLAWPVERAAHPALQAFRRWLLREAAA